MERGCSSSYRIACAKILSEGPIVLGKVSLELGAQRERFRISLESRVDNPESTLASFNRQFALNGGEKEAVELAWPLEAGETMFHVVNTYTRVAQMEGLAAESSFRLSQVGGEYIGDVELRNELWFGIWGMKYGPVGLEGTPIHSLFFPDKRMKSQPELCSGSQTIEGLLIGKFS